MANKKENLQKNLIRRKSLKKEVIDEAVSKEIVQKVHPELKKEPKKVEVVQPKKEKESVKGITIMFPESIYKRVKFYAFNNGLTFKKVTVKAVEEFLDAQGA